MEVDILARSSSDELWIVEVKSSGYEEFASARLKVAQQQRLQRVAQKLIEADFNVRVALALVHDPSDIQWVDAFNFEEIE